MSLILVVESEGRHAERVRDGLGSDGWQVEVVTSCEAAVAAVADRAPQLVFINAELPGAREMLRSLSRAQGGPGSIALLPEMVGRDLGPFEADETLLKPFSEKDLRQLARRVVASARTPRRSETEADQKRLTSQELFGDLLAEVESEAESVPPQRVAPAPAPSASPRSLEMEQRLERTLSGIIKEEKVAAVPPAKKTSSNIDAMLTATLSGLDMPKRVLKSAPAPPAAAKPPEVEPPTVSARAAATPAPAPRVPPTLASPPPATRDLAPESSSATAHIPIPPATLPIPPAAAKPPEVEPPTLDAPLPAPRPAEPPAVRRASREIDLSQLEELARPRSRDTPAPKPTPPKESFATQKVSIPPSFLQAPSSEFGQYTLLERIAVGGMAEVWKARMKGVEGFQKTVAIKKILPHLTDSSDFVTMFIDEAKLAAQLNHNNIIHIYDLGKIGEDYFIAMEFVDGKDLRSILNTARAESRPLPLGLALLVGSRLASALDHAHRQKDFEGRPLGLVHRDVSPQNVLISFDGDIKLCDFGIVKAVTKTSKTQMGALKGKLQYMSPEQAWGRPVDARSDIFSLGSLIFEMLTGRRLFSGESEMSVLDAVREGRIQAPRDLDPRLPLEVNALVLKALARDPDDRFQSSGEMQREIDNILASLKPTPTHADLGSYLQQLFAAEAKAAAPAYSGALSPSSTAGARGGAGAPSVAVPARQADVAVVAPTGVSKVDEPDAGRSGRMLWLAIAGVAAAGLIAYFYFGRGDRSAAPPDPAPAGAESSVAPGETPGAVAPADGSGVSVAPGAESTAAGATGTAAVAGASVDQMVSDEVKRREDELKKKYEDELAKRKAELDKLNTKPPEPAPAQEARPEPPAAPLQEVKAPEPAPQETAPQSSAPAEAEAPPVSPPPVSAEPQEAPAVAPPAPATPSVKEGDLVRVGPGVRPPVLVSLTKPEYPAMARRLKVEGTVIVSLLVDETGRVLETRLDSGVSQNVGINEAAIAAARSAVFRPATKEGVRVKMWYQLKIPFKL
jgi:TonB family protein